jgi:hypothetical protein
LVSEEGITSTSDKTTVLIIFFANSLAPTCENWLQTKSTSPSASPLPVLPSSPLARRSYSRRWEDRRRTTGRSALAPHRTERSAQAPAREGERCAGEERGHPPLPPCSGGERERRAGEERTPPASPVLHGRRGERKRATRERERASCGWERGWEWEKSQVPVYIHRVWHLAETGCLGLATLTEAGLFRGPPSKMDVNFWWPATLLRGYLERWLVGLRRKLNSMVKREITIYTGLGRWIAQYPTSSYVACCLVLDCFCMMC